MQQRDTFSSTSNQRIRSQGWIEHEWAGCCEAALGTRFSGLRCVAFFNCNLVLVKRIESNYGELAAELFVEGGGGRRAGWKGETMLPRKPNLVEIVDQPLDFVKYVDAVRHPGAGAVATFHGTTRDTFEDQRVLELQYEAYSPMACAELEKICEQARQSWSLIGVAVAHRIGVVPVGDESVFVAVSSVHRKDALAACQFVIDELKASTPIWKKEVYENGAVWKQNPEFRHGQRRSCCHKPDQHLSTDHLPKDEKLVLDQHVPEQATQEDLN